MFFIWITLLISHLAKAAPFKAYLKQSPELLKPKRGSVTGEYGGLDWGADELAKGSFSVNMGFSFPSSRGDLVYPVEPQYSPQAGLSEWGLGVATNLTISRIREGKPFDFEHGALLSPWGRLLKGSDGYYYAEGLSSRVRLELGTDEAIAYLEDGTKVRFGLALKTLHGSTLWYVIEATNAREQVSRYSYREEEGTQLLERKTSYDRGFLGQNAAVTSLRPKRISKREQNYF